RRQRGSTMPRRPPSPTEPPWPSSGRKRAPIARPAAAPAVPPALGRTSAGVDHHACGDRVVGGLVDQDEPAGEPVTGVVVDEERLGDPQRDAADLVETERGGLLVAVERVDVQPVL